MPDISLLLREHSPSQLVQMGLASALEEYLHDSYSVIPDELSMEIMQALKMIP